MKCLLIIAAIILMYSLAVADDAEIDKKEAEMCKEMVDLFIESNGSLGWPKEVCE